MSEPSKIAPLIPYLRRKLTVEEQLEFLRLSVEEVWGSGSLLMTFIEDNGINVKELAAKHGWRYEEGTLICGFFRGKPEISLRFGDRPDKKTLRQMVNEEKKKKNEPK